MYNNDVRTNVEKKITIKEILLDKYNELKKECGIEFRRK